MIYVFKDDEKEVINKQPSYAFEDLTDFIGWVIENGQVTAMEY